jgi:hypothetical protein
MKPYNNLKTSMFVSRTAGATALAMAGVGACVAFGFATHYSASVKANAESCKGVERVTRANVMLDAKGKNGSNGGQPLSQLSRHALNALVSAIYRAEGGLRATQPYGILVTHGGRVQGHLSEPQARLLCEATVLHAWRDFVLEKNSGEFIPFLASRYCPPSVDRRGNKHWIHNVTYFYQKTICAVPNENRT